MPVIHFPQFPFVMAKMMTIWRCWVLSERGNISVKSVTQFPATPLNRRFPFYSGDREHAPWGEYKRKLPPICNKEMAQRTPTLGWEMNPLTLVGLGRCQGFSGEKCAQESLARKEGSPVLSCFRSSDATPETWKESNAIHNSCSMHTVSSIKWRPQS